MLLELMRKFEYDGQVNPMIRFFLASDRHTNCV